MKLKLIAKLSPPRSLSAEATGIVSIGRNNFKVHLRKDPTFNKYVITIETHRIPISAIVHQIGATLLPNDLNTVIGRVFNFNILNARVVYPFGAQPPQILISGTPQMFGVKTIHMTAVAIRYSGRIRVIQKYSIGSINVADFIRKLVGVSLHRLFILNQEVEIGFIVSPSTLKGVSLSIPEFKGFSIDRGISIKTTLGWPSNCASDPFCAVAKRLLGGAKLNLQATIANARSFTMTASVGNLRLGKGVVLNQAGLQIVSGASPSVGLVGSIKLSKPPITLGAAIRATPSGVKLEGSMSGCWYNAFGSRYLTICNLFLAMTIVPGAITGLEMGGKIQMGDRRCGRVLHAEGYIGINVINPNDNYYYADIGPITFRKFFDAFCLRVSLPRPLAESGFPNGIKASFSLLGKELPHARISIPPGYRFKGTINILGLRAYADINILLPTKVYIKAALPPLRIANIFKMYASRHDRRRGPYLIADIRIGRTPHIEASGFVEVLGISREVKLLITASKYQFSMHDRFLNLFHAGLRITANYGSFSRANFRVEGWFKNDLFNRIAGIVRDGLKRSADQANHRISAAQRNIASKKAAFHSADRRLHDAQRRVNDAKRAFDHAVAKVEHIRRRLNSVCHIRSCGSVCIGCPSGWHCCRRVWGRCVCKRPGWNSCCRRVPNPVCISQNAKCWALKKPLDLALRGAVALIHRSRHVLNVANGALHVARGVVHAAKRTLDAANAILEGVKRAYRVGVNAISALTRFALTQIINIREIYFNVGLNVASGGRFQCRVRGTLMGRHINIHLGIDTRNIGSIARSLADRALSGLSRFIG